MDREISIQERRKRKKRLIIKIFSVAVLLILPAALVPRWIEGRLDVKKLEVAEVDYGPIEVTVGASGKLTPLLEEIIVSPVNSRILEVYKNPGDSVKAGEPLLKLDIASAETEYSLKTDEMEILKSKEIQVKIRLDNLLRELTMEQQIKEMQLKQLLADVEGEKYLNKIGASTPDKVSRAELNYEEAKLQLQLLGQKIENERANAGAELRVQQLESSILEKTIEDRARLLQDARILSPKAATLTFILNQIGTQVSQGSQLAIISDLTRFKVECEISDGHREKLAPGSKAVIEIGAIRLTGTVFSVTPSVTNGLIRFTVIPDDSSHPSLRSGLSADVNIIHGILNDVARIPNKKHLNYGTGDYYLWVIEGNKAVKKKVRLGNASFIPGLAALRQGDDTILHTSDGSAYRCIRSSFMDTGFDHPFILIEELTHELMQVEKASYERIIRMMSHEVNNSVGAISATLNVVSDMIRQEPDADGWSDILPAVDASFERSGNLAQFIKNLANVVKVPEPSFSDISLREMVRSVKALTTIECSKRNIQLTSSLPEEDIIIRADGIQLEQVIVNVIKNSWEAIGGKGEIRLTVSASPLTLTIEDNGPGMTPDVQKTLFTSFFTTKATGYGMGLMFVREVLNNHNYKFSLSASNGWTQFKVFFE